MSQLLQYSPGLTKRQQVFTSSGTFTPSPRLLALGGWVEVLAVGGGGGGWTNGGYIRRGGSGGQVVRGITQVSGPTAVTVGAGGLGKSSPDAAGTQGGTSSLGSVSAAGGLPAGQYAGGNPDWYGYGIDPSGSGSGGPGTRISGSWFVHGAGGPGTEGYGCGGAGSTSTSRSPVDGAANTGHGGSFGGNGGSGIVIVEWWE